MPSLCLEKAIIAAAHIPQTSTDGNADLAAVDALSPGDFRLLDTSHVIGVNTAGLCRSGMSQSHRQSCYQAAGNLPERGHPQQQGQRFHPPGAAEYAPLL